MENNTLGLRFYGAGISPIIFRSKDVGEILICLEETLKTVLKDIEPDIKIDDVYIAPVDIKDESLGLNFRPNVALLLTAFQIICDSLSGNNFDTLPSKSLESLKEIQSKVRKYNCKAEFILDNRVAAQLTPDTSISISENQKIKGDTIIYGTVQRVGGADPKCRIQLLEGYAISISITQAIAKEIASNLYGLISLNGSAVWNRKDNHIIDFKISSIGSYKKKTTKDAFKELRDSIGDRWDKIDDIDGFLLND